MEQEVQEELRKELALAHELVRDNITFAKRIARKFYRKRINSGIDAEDYESAALLGLCSAAERYKPESGTSFQTFSYFRICGSMYDLVRQTGLIPRPCCDEILGGSAPETGHKDIPAHRRLLLTHSATELAYYTDMLEMIGIKLFPGPDEKSTAISYAHDIGPEGATAERNVRSYLQRMVNQLPEDERQLIELRYFFGYSVKEICDAFGKVSKGWLSRLHNRALVSLRNLLEEQDLLCAERVKNYGAQ